MHSLAYPFSQKGSRGTSPFIALSIRAKMISGGRPLLYKNFADTEPRPPLQNADFQSIFTRSTLDVTLSIKFNKH